MTKITTYIDDKLLKEALRASGARSQREVIEEALRNLLADIRRHRFVKDFDSFRLNFSFKTLKKSRA